MDSDDTECKKFVWAIDAATSPHNVQDHRAGGPTRVIVEKRKTLNEANDVEKPKT